MAIRTRRRSILRQAIANNAPPTPANASAVWWADDIAQADGSQVATWTDRVNNISVTQATANARPLYAIAGVNGRPSVNFGSDDFMSYLAPNALTTSAQGCVVAVVQFSAVGVASPTVCSTADHSGNTQFLDFRRYDTGEKLEVLQRDVGTLNRVNGDDTVPANQLVATEWASNDTVWTVRLNNEIQSLSVGNGANNGGWFADVSARDGFSIGALRRNTVDNFLNGHVAYLGVFDTPLSTQDRYDLYKWIESYYGITGMPGLSDYEQTVLADSPSAFWPMQETSGNIMDISGGGHNGIKAGSGGVTYGTSGPALGVSAIEFAGLSGVGYSVADNDAWSSTDLTVEGWYYPDASFGSGQRWMISKYAGSSVLTEWLILAYTANRTLYSLITNSGNTGWRRREGGMLVGETWQHVAIVLSSGTFTMYLNGVSVGSLSSSGTRRTNSPGGLQIGHTSVAPAESWKGRMTMLAFYSHALTQPQIQAHYEAMTT